MDNKHSGDQKEAGTVTSTRLLCTAQLSCHQCPRGYAPAPEAMPFHHTHLHKRSATVITALADHMTELPSMFDSD
jgi:hypothetical protein